jgi:hypothetical protein
MAGSGSLYEDRSGGGRDVLSRCRRGAVEENAEEECGGSE